MPVTKDSALYLKGVIDKTIIGATIVGTEMVDCEDEGWWGIKLLLDGEELLLTPSCDEEGNNPGWLFIEGGPE